MDQCYNTRKADDSKKNGSTVQYLCNQELRDHMPLSQNLQNNRTTPCCRNQGMIGYESKGLISIYTIRFDAYDCHSDV